MPTDPPPAVENERVDLEAIRAREQDKDITKFLGHARIDILSLLREVARLQALTRRTIGDGNTIFGVAGNNGSSHALTMFPIPMALNIGDSLPDLTGTRVGGNALVWTFTNPKSVDVVIGMLQRIKASLEAPAPQIAVEYVDVSAVAALRAHPGAEGKESES